MVVVVVYGIIVEAANDAGFVVFKSDDRRLPTLSVRDIIITPPTDTDGDGPAKRVENDVVVTGTGTGRRRL